jgi:hypothetical protein
MASPERGLGCPASSLLRSFLILDSRGFIGCACCLFLLPVVSKVLIKSLLGMLCHASFDKVLFELIIEFLLHLLIV